MDPFEPQHEDNEAGSRRYFIDERWFDQTNRSYRAMAQSRMCDSCKES